LELLDVYYFSVEHILYSVTALSDNHTQITQCTPKFKDFWENLVFRYRPHLHYNIPYSVYELPLYEVSKMPIALYYFIYHLLYSQWVGLLQGFSWNYGDIFVVILAMGINFRFNQFNDYFRLILRNENLMTKATWSSLRVHYFQLVELVYFIDSHVSLLILFSLGHNMLILVFKIFNAFKYEAKLRTITCWID
jgi:hypothetical protein